MSYLGVVTLKLYCFSLLSNLSRGSTMRVLRAGSQMWCLEGKHDRFLASNKGFWIVSTYIWISGFASMLDTRFPTISFKVPTTTRRKLGLDSLMWPSLPLPGSSSAAVSSPNMVSLLLETPADSWPNHEALGWFWAKLGYLFSLMYPPRSDDQPNPDWN
jgi:hypothetical protein